ncbi:MAG TPA: NAD-dependent epimerase/dehydratase family protein [Chloroflexota bacterium]|jgi:CDP-glucose 4,6-dehydratase
MKGSWTDRRVLVTGATGVVGGWVVRRLLDAGAHVVALVRDHDERTDFYRSGAHRRCAIVTGQLEDYPTVERAVNEHEIDTVIHLAAQPIVGAAQRSPLPTFEANVRGTYNLLEACRVHGGLVERVVVASSDKAYGDHGQRAYDETAPLIANHPYDVSKACADLIAQTYAHSYGMSVAIARCGNIYGGGDLNWNRIVPGTIRSLLAGERPVVRSDGTAVRDYLYVEDAADAYLLLAERAARPDVRGQAFNFSPEAPVTVLALVEQIAAAVGARLEPDVRATARNEIPYQALRSDKARRVLGWAPRYDLAAGLRETVAWYRAYLADLAPASTATR